MRQPHEGICNQLSEYPDKVRRGSVMESAETTDQDGATGQAATCQQKALAIL
jgi:hypothetical protein